MYKRLYFIGIVAYALMFVFAILFYKERIIILDTADTLFYIIAKDSFSLYASRFGALVTQVLPLLCVKWGLSLDHVILSYSLGFVFFYFVCYLICGLLLKNYQMALVLLLFHILFVTDTFYYIPSELPQGVNFLFVIMAFAHRQQLRQKLGAASLVLMVFLFLVAAFFHPLVMVVLLFLLLFYYFYDRAFYSKKAFLLILCSFFAGLTIKSLFFSIPYDRQAASGMKNFISLFPNYLDIYSNRLFINNCITKYYWMPLLAAGISLIYLARKEWLKLALFLCFFLGYLMVVNISYPTAATPIFYIENLYLPLAIILAVPFVYIVIPFLSKYKLAIPVFVLIIITSSARFYTAHNFYTTRLHWERRFLAQHAGTKMIFPARNTPMDTLLMPWGTPYEFWLLSTTETGNTASLIIDDKPELRPWAAGLNNSFLVNWNVYKYKVLNTKYFHFTDTISGYTIIK